MRLALALLALLLVGCSSREHLNPFDPDNPETHGRPSGFVALAGSAVITLQWQHATAAGLLGYRVERRIEGDSTWTVIGELPASATGFGDFGVRNGVDHHYRLYFVFSAGTALLPAEDTATPGPLRPWTADLDAGLLLRLTPDARHAAFSVADFDGPTQVAVDPVSGIVWTCDTIGQRVVLLVPGLPAPRVIGPIPDPIAVAVDPADATGWICDASNDRVIHVDSNGIPASPQIVSPVRDPVAIAVDPRDRTVWVCENEGNELRRFDRDGAPMWGADMPRPSRVAIDSTTGGAWVTSFNAGQVRVVTSQGVVVDTIGGFRGPIGIAVDWYRGRIWVAEAAADRVVALHRNGSEEFRVGGLGEPREIAVDLRTGDAWVTTPADGAIARIAANGTVIRKVVGLQFPYGISLDPGTR
jgi:DNA-binding beta-propeller fold protein YncE